jgi:hypothetical protein
MSTSQCVPDGGLGDLQPSVPLGVKKSWLLKGMLIGFAACMIVGLALATWYVGARIVEAKEPAKVAAPKPRLDRSPL